MPHSAIIGMTESGKTFLARKFAKEFKARGYPVLVLRKPREQWEATECTFQTPDPEEFLFEYDSLARKNWESGDSAIAFLELSDSGVEKYDKRFHRLFSAGRHDGFKLFYLSQRPAIVHPTIRENCISLYLFYCDGKAVKNWAESFADQDLMKATTLPKYYFIHKPSRFDPALIKTLKT